MIHSYEISGMHCSSCVMKITKALKDILGIEEATVTLNPPEVVMEMNSHVPLERLQQTVKAAGDYSLKKKTAAASLDVVAQTQTTDMNHSLTPLFVILSYIVGGVVLRASLSGDFSFHTIMTNFMGGFFVVFSLFKMINLSGFAEAYSTYDVLAKRSKGYALAYPFIELTLGVAYLVSFAPIVVNIITLVLMIVGSVGVVQALASKKSIQCACLGTSLKLPMTKVTLAEDVVMGLMALVMLLF